MMDAVYLYSVYDDPIEPNSKCNVSSGILSPNSKRRRLNSDSLHLDSISANSSSPASLGVVDQLLEDDNEAGSENMDADSYTNADGDRDSPSPDSREESEDDDPEWLVRPIVLPRRRFVGACNIEVS
jgi:hypothetical protein